MRKIDWDNVKEASENYPKPGGYIAVITNVTDKEDKEYLKIEWDYVMLPYKGYNKDTFDRTGFWPAALIRSYKEKALPFFKAFKTALEESNHAYTFDEEALWDMHGKCIGVVLGEEEYQNPNGDIKKRLYVAHTRSVEAIKKGDFKVPDLKKLPTSNVNNLPGWSGTDEDLPF